MFPSNSLHCNSTLISSSFSPKKLPKLGTKLRQDIKLEPITETSSISTNSKQSDAKENDLNSINVKREKISVGVRSQINNSDDPDSSILLIPNEVNIITLSDDDEDEINDDNKMPPPTMPAPKKQPAKKTRNTQKSVTESSASETNSTQSSEASTTKLEPKKTKKAKKPKKPVLPMVEIKKEKVADDTDLPNDETAGPEKNAKKKSSEKVNGDTGSKNATLESVYEDASDKIPSVSHFVNCNIVHEINKFFSLLILFGHQQTSGLAVSATYVLQKNSVKENGHSEPVSNVNKVGKTKASFSSIITEDDSDDDTPLQVLKNTKNHKELFK